MIDILDIHLKYVFAISFSQVLFHATLSLLIDHHWNSLKEKNAVYTHPSNHPRKAENEVKYWLYALSNQS